MERHPGEMAPVLTSDDYTRHRPSNLDSILSRRMRLLLWSAADRNKNNPDAKKLLPNNVTVILYQLKTIPWNVTDQRKNQSNPDIRLKTIVWTDKRSFLMEHQKQVIQMRIVPVE
jgi:hypothetical protein